MRLWLYQLIMALLLPLWLLYAWRRCRQEGRPGLCWRQLWCLSLPNLPPSALWVHAVSLGETQAALILLRRLRQQQPELPVFFTGGNRSATRLARESGLSNLHVSYLPLDYAWLRQRLFKRLKPRLLLLLETEFWPNLLHQAHQQATPVVVIQARLSQSSKRLYPRWGQPLLHQLLAPVRLFAAQTQADAQTLVALGAQPDRVQLLGNLKYDFALPSDLAEQTQRLQQQLPAGRWLWTAGSTHPQEELPLLEAHRQLLAQAPESLLILAPRHPDHFERVATVLTQQGWNFIRWSDWQGQSPLPSNTQVLLLDTLGQLLYWYALSHACFVGGSLVPWGGHNLLEPAALGKPLLAGPHNHNFGEIAQDLEQGQALTLTDTAKQLAMSLSDWQQHPMKARQLGLRARERFLAHQGTTERLLQAITPYLSSDSTKGDDHTFSADNQSQRQQP